jgi:hypothetical protein
MNSHPLHESASIQAVIAVLIVAKLSASALSRIVDTAVLKGLPFVVVGIYFGRNQRVGPLGSTEESAPELRRPRKISRQTSTH